MFNNIVKPNQGQAGVCFDKIFETSQEGIRYFYTWEQWERNREKKKLNKLRYTFSPHKIHKLL